MSQGARGHKVDIRNIDAEGNVTGIHEEHHYYSRPEVLWPCQVGRVPLLAGCFQSRALGDELVQAVGEGGTAVLTQILAGLGGVGKTQLAVQFAERSWTNGELDLRVWITAASREAIVSGYASAADKLGLTDGIVGDGDEEQASQRFLEWLNSTDRRWLIVLDDVQDPRHLDGLWPPPDRPSGRIVVTTRRQDAALRGHKRQVLQVGLFSPNEALTYLHKKFAHDPDATDEAAELAADLGYLPLALTQAAAYIADQGLTCADYHRRLGDSRTALAQLLPGEEEPVPDEYGRTVAATWALSIERADELAPAGLARPLLELASVLDPNDAPSELFTTAAALTYLASATAHTGRSPRRWRLRRPKPRRMRTPTANDVAKALHNLRRFSLAEFDERNTPDTGLDTRQRNIRVHALVQRATRDQTPDLATTAHAAADALLQVWPEIERDTAFSHTLRANTDALRTHTHDHLWAPDAHSVLFRAGNSRGNAGLVTAAATYFEDLANHTTRLLGRDHPDTLATRNNLASWRGRAGDAAGAAAAFEELLPDSLRLLGPDHPDTLTTRNNLAHWRDRANGV